MIHRFRVLEELDTPVAIAVGAYLDCEHYLFLHRSITGKLEILKHEGRSVTVRQTWKWFGLTMGHIKTGEYFPPGEFKIYNVVPSPAWVPSIHHLIDIKTHLQYVEKKENNSTMMIFDVELNMPFWLYPFRNFLQKLIEDMHARQSAEDMECIKYRAKMFGRENNSAYLADHQFLYHKDDYVRCFGKSSKILSA